MSNWLRSPIDSGPALAHSHRIGGDTGPAHYLLLLAVSLVRAFASTPGSQPGRLHFRRAAGLTHSQSPCASLQPRSTPLRSLATPAADLGLVSISNEEWLSRRPPDSERLGPRLGPGLRGLSRQRFDHRRAPGHPRRPRQQRPLVRHQRHSGPRPAWSPARSGRRRQRHGERRADEWRSPPPS